MRKPVKSNERTARTEARLGIFWFVKGKLLIDSTPLSECEHYGDHLNYPEAILTYGRTGSRSAKSQPNLSTKNLHAAGSCAI